MVVVHLQKDLGCRFGSHLCRDPVLWGDWWVLAAGPVGQAGTSSRGVIDPSLCSAVYEVVVIFLLQGDMAHPIFFRSSYIDWKIDSLTYVNLFFNHFVAISQATSQSPLRKGAMVFLRNLGAGCSVGPR